MPPKSLRSLGQLAALGSLLSLALVLPEAEAHWCTNIYDTPSRIVVKPERDTVFLDGTVNAQEILNVWVRNNFPYTISGVTFSLNSASSTYFTIVAPPTPTNQTIQPGENKFFPLTIRRKSAGGSGSLGLLISLFRHFPGGPHDITTSYFTKATPTAQELAASDSQAEHLRWAKATELDPTGTPLATMLTNYGSPRLSYNFEGVPHTASEPWSASEHYTSPNQFTLGGDDFDHCHLLRGQLDLAILQLSDTRITQVFLDNMDDPMPMWRGLAAIVAAAFRANTEVHNRITSMMQNDTCVKTDICTKYSQAGVSFTSSNHAKLLAKAALVVAGESQYRDEVNLYANNSSNPLWERLTAAAALGMAGEDAPMTNILLPQSKDSDQQTVYLFASYLVDLVVTKRRGLTRTGCVTFFGECCQKSDCAANQACVNGACIVSSDTTPPRAPTNLRVQPAT